MTVILDPGNKPESYTDAQRRQWQNTAGLWKTDAGVYLANYNAAVASRDYWQHTVAHNDPNVWDNRYNAGYSAGQSAGYSSGYAAGDAAGRAAVIPAGSGQTPVAISTSGTFSAAGHSMSLNLTLTGYWVLVVTPTGTCVYNETAAGSPQFQYQLAWPGGNTGSINVQPAVDSGGGDGTARIPFGHHVAGVWSPGTATFQILGMFSMTMSMPLGLTAYYVPTPTYPH